MLEKLRKANEIRLYNTPAYAKCLDWTLADWSNAIAGETGEMCNLIKKIRRGDTIDPKDVGKELADSGRIELVILSRRCRKTIQATD